ncbi:class I SAM-dependent methyltransferase [candidate division WOR-3 bacterium]|nr:class I SAM-dependent methyltransferase [candidate division WOR-3 bacterium]
MNDNHLQETIRLANAVGDPKHAVTANEGIFLYNRAKECSKGVIVEIGSWKGRSAVWLGRGSQAGFKREVYAVDPHTGSPEHHRLYGKIWTLPVFQKNIERAGLSNIVVSLVKTSEEASKDWKEPIELLFIDGRHDYKYVKQDYDLWSRFLIPGGIVVFHDSIRWPGPKLVVDEVIYKTRDFMKVGIINSITWAVKKKT